MEEIRYAVEEFIPVEIKPINSRELPFKVATVAVITAIRSDGCMEIVLPLAHIYLDASMRPVEKWAENKGAHVKRLEGRQYTIEQPLMPIKKERAKKETKAKKKGKP